MDLKNEILKIAGRQKTFKTSDIVKSIKGSLSRQYVSYVIREMVEKGELIKGGITAGSFYALPEYRDLIANRISTRLKRELLEEHRVFNNLKDKAEFIQNLNENVLSVLFYAFTEMLNNAIEHSRSKYVEIEIKKEINNITFVVNDFGIGVFKNVMKERGLDSELEAIQDLLKGKTTTQPHSHTGEGIFFTSKVGDVFILESFGYRLRVDNVIDDFFIEELTPQKRGTKVIFSINLNSSRHLNDMFSHFVTEPGEVGFNKTDIKVRLYTRGTVYISRSQARRIMAGLEKYEHIILDFDRVTTVGQAFADEIFRVFQERYPDIKIEPINMIEPIKFMIDRVEKP